MKSKVQIDIDWDNLPCISLEHNQSEDVRDKMVKRFMESFSGLSSFCLVSFVNHNLDSNQKVIIRPLRPEDLEGYKDAYLSAISSYKHIINSNNEK